MHENIKIYSKQAVVILITAGVVVALCVWIFSFLYGHSRHFSSVGPERNVPLPKEVAVTLTRDGFKPQTVTLAVGGAVRWSNQSGSNNASVNSDDYPTNRLFPELNLGKFSAGSTLVHIFTHAGTYTYHNQFSHTQTGTIIVHQ